MKLYFDKNNNNNVGINNIIIRMPQKKINTIFLYTYQTDTFIKWNTILIQ